MKDSLREIQRRYVALEDKLKGIEATAAISQRPDQTVAE